MTAQPPSTSKNLERLTNTILPLFVPSPSTSTAPLLESFVASHDKLMEDDSLFTHRADLATARVNLDAAYRELRKQETPPAAATPAAAEEMDVKTLLSNTRKGRLRSRLENQAGGLPTQERNTTHSPLASRPSTPAGPAEETSESVIAEFEERRRVFDDEMVKAQEEALSEFKKSLREYMLNEAKAMG